jgi:hypothetical protein
MHKRDPNGVTADNNRQIVQNCGKTLSKISKGMM